VRTQAYTDGQIIVEENAEGGSMFFVKEGMASIVREGNVIRQISKNDYFGERSILLNEVRSATVTASGEVVLYELLKENLDETISNSLRNLMIQRMALKNDKITLQDLHPV
jgi:cGMP-dependent protein kinase